VLFILADDLGYMDIGANNPKTFYETPNIDALAKSGMRFTAGYSACCVCSPTRASIMTGKYPQRVGITDYIGRNRPDKLLPAPNANHLALEEITIAERMRDAGYTNFFAGKWHLGNGQFYPGAQGFPADLVGQSQFFYPKTDMPPPDKTNDGKTSDRIADEAVRFIETNKDKQFFAYLPFQAVHIPIFAKPELIAKYERKKTSAPPDAWGHDRDSEIRLVQNHAAYAAMLEQMDSAIGRVLAALDKSGLSERTIVIFTSDNGGLATAEGRPTANVPLRAGKGWPYEGGVRVAWIVRAPGVTKPGSLCDTPVISTDFYPTMLELTGQTTKRAEHFDGVSFEPLLKGRKLARGPLFWHYPHYGNQGGAPYGAIRDGDWKLIEWYEDGKLELFNLKDDLGETKNLAENNPAKVKALREKLVAWRKDVNAVMPTPNPDSSAATPAKKQIKKKADK
jgi:arylsulfatase A-like enzyme